MKKVTADGGDFLSFQNRIQNPLHGGGADDSLALADIDG